MDDSSIICLCLQLSNSKILASAKEGACHGLGVCCCTRAACSVELVIHAQVGLGLGWSSSHAQYFLVAHCLLAVDLHFHYKIRWCLEWILLVGILRSVGFRQAFIGIGRNVVVRHSSPYMSALSFLGCW